MTGATAELLRVQFALTAGIHFLFVGLTIGLVTIVALVQTRATLSGSAVHQRMTVFWGRLYIVNYGVGIISGLVMEFQLGLNWSGLTKVAGGVFGAPLALETVVAFFIESTFVGLWIFGRHRMNAWVHTALIWIVAFTAYASAYFVLVANGFLNRPVGYRMRAGVAELVDPAALFGNPSAVLAFLHVLVASLLLAGVVLAAVSASHLRRGTAEQEFFRRSARIGLITMAVTAFPVAITGGVQFSYLAPTKLGGDDGRAAAARFAARFGAGDYAPPALAGAGEGVMMTMWVILLIVSIAGFVKVFTTRWLLRGRVFHVVLMVAAPLPFVAMVAGWVFREVGRQPWAIYGVLTVEDAVSGISRSSAVTSTAVFVAMFGALLLLDVWLLGKFARRGPVSGNFLGGDTARQTAFTPSF